MADHGSGHDGEHHAHGGNKKYVMVFGALCVLTAISFVVGNSSFIMSTAIIGWSLMMAVSCAKALLVMGFFMHLIWESNWKYVLTIPASIMSIFLMLMLVPDVGRRTDYYARERWNFAAVPQKADHHEANHAGEHKGEHPNDDAAGGHATDETKDGVHP